MTTKPRKRKPDPRGTEVIYVRVPTAAFAQIKERAVWPHTMASIAGELIVKQLAAEAPKPEETKP